MFWKLLRFQGKHAWAQPTRRSSLKDGSELARAKLNAQRKTLVSMFSADFYGQTPLHLATAHGHPKTVAGALPLLADLPEGENRMDIVKELFSIHCQLL